MVDRLGPAVREPVDEEPGGTAEVLGEQGFEALAVHRLDRDVSGALLLARSERVRTALEQAFRDRTVRKQYWALARGRMARDAGIRWAKQQFVWAEIEPRPADGVFRMPIQRVFSKPGFGTVVTGIPVSGAARLGDVLSELYLASSVVKRFHDEGEQQADLPLMQWAMEDSLYNIQESLRSLFRNMPARPLAWLLRLLVFPTGTPFSEPTDRTASRAARLLLAPSASRDRLSAGIYVTRDRNEPVGRLELALELSVQLEAAEKRIRDAVKAGTIHGSTPLEIAAAALAQGIIDTGEHDALVELEGLRDQVIAVDAFDDYGSQHLLQKAEKSHAA